MKNMHISRKYLYIIRRYTKISNYVDYQLQCQRQNQFRNKNVISPWLVFIKLYLYIQSHLYIKQGKSLMQHLVEEKNQNPSHTKQKFKSTQQFESYPEKVKEFPPFQQTYNEHAVQQSADTIKKDSQLNSQMPQSYQLNQINPSNVNLAVQPQNLLQKINDTIETEKNKQQTQNKIKNKHKQHYKSFVDGLRSIAIISVVIFHYWPQTLSGGFIGVDIFFVISGYLITSIIVREMRQNKYSIVKFYYRRIKRIYPALIIVFVFLIVVGCWRMLSLRLKMMTRSISIATVFGANLEFLTFKKDYFDPELSTNPVLHLWSLGVEEQFYIIWPLIIYIIVRFFEKRAIYILAGYTLLSFLLNVICVYRDTQFAFYFPFSRFWEMAIGGILAYSKIKIANKIVANFISAVSLIMMVGTLFIIDQESLFPGWWALSPTLFAASVIVVENNSLFNKYVLSSRPLVYIGKISYPLYLWHWPLLVFSKLFYPKGSKSIFSNFQVMLFLAILFSVLTYEAAEKFLRRRTSKKIIYGLFLMMMAIGILSLVISVYPRIFSMIAKRGSIGQIQLEMMPTQQDLFQKEGKQWPNSSKNPHRKQITVDKFWTYNSVNQLQQSSILFPVTANSKYFEPQMPVMLQNMRYFQTLNQGSSKTIFLIGDSHTIAVATRFKHLYEESISKNTSHNFPTIVYMMRTMYPYFSCSGDGFYNFTRQMITKHKPDRVFFVFWWETLLGSLDKNGPLHENSDCFHGFPRQDYKSYKDVLYDIEKYKNEFKQIKSQGSEVYVATMNPTGSQFNPQEMIDGYGVIEQSTKPVELSQYRGEQQIKLMLQPLQNALKSVNISMVNFEQNQCWNGTCQVLTPKGFPIYFDTNHFSSLYGKYWLSSVDFLTQFE